MNVNIFIFGQLEDVTGTSVISINHVADTDLLLNKLYTQYPLLKEKKFLIAVDNQIIHKKTEILKIQRSMLWWLPPYVTVGLLDAIQA